MKKRRLGIFIAAICLASTAWSFWIFSSDKETPLEAPEDSSEYSDSNLVPELRDSRVYLDEIDGERTLTGQRSWVAPDFSNQELSLGYKKEEFEVPDVLRKNFEFWKQIYSRYSGDYGLLHDPENPEVVYEILDFTAITANAKLNPVQKQIAREKMLRLRKAYYVSLIKKLSKSSDREKLNDGDEKRVWDLWAKSDDPQKLFDGHRPQKMRFQLGQKDRIVQGIYYSGRYIEEFERIFREEKLPAELTRLIFVESSFNVLARSRVGASGLWQIMPNTAKPYMRQNPSVDRRNEPFEATRMAAKILRKNYELLGAWPLAVTGWNHGPNGIAKLIKKYGTNDIGELVRNVKSRKSFGFASRNFYAAFLAVLHVEREADKYFEKPTWSRPLNVQKIKLSKTISYQKLISLCDGDKLKADIYNPHISFASRKKGLPIPPGTVVYLPEINLTQN